MSVKTTLAFVALSLVVPTVAARAETAPSPRPGTASTSAALLSPAAAEPISFHSDTPVLAQGRQPRVGRRGSNPNYIGIGGLIGLTGETALGESGFVVNGRINFSPTPLSLRPAVIIGTDAVFLFPVTYDFVQTSESFLDPAAIAPFAGAGVAIATDNDDQGAVGFLLTGGIDIPISRDFTGNASLNFGIFDEQADLGLLVGVAYNLPPIGDGR